MGCTWRDCTNSATTPQIADDGEKWAELCGEHAAEQAKAQESGDAKAILRCWVLAHGSREAFARRMGWARSDTKLRTVEEMSALLSAAANESLSVSESGKPDTVFLDFSRDLEPILREWAQKIVNQTVYRTKGHDWSIDLKALFRDLGL